MIIMMLRGQAPSRGIPFDLPIYLVLARSILQGDVIAFQETVQSPQFVEDRP
jgi:hypothetical protein